MPSTTRYKRGEIVLVSFPFTDLSSSKRRPALVLSPDAFNAQRQDLVLVAITSQPADVDAVAIDGHDCVGGTLPLTSFVKVAKLFTMHSMLVVKPICALRPEKLDTVLSEVRLHGGCQDARMPPAVVPPLRLSPSARLDRRLRLCDPPARGVPVRRRSR